jgi:acyl-CoA dehydrogenase
MAWEFYTEPEFQEQLDWIKTFMKEEVDALDTLWPELHHCPPAPWMRKVIDPLKQQVKDRGLWATHLPPELGGKGFGQVKLALINEIIGYSHWAPIIFGIQGPDTGNAEILAHYGTEEQKKKYLQPLLDGEIFSCFSMTEPQCGSDPQQFKTRAVRDGDDWVINGEKFYSSNINNASFTIVMTITNPDVSVHKGSSMFLVPRGTPGIEILRHTEVMGRQYDPRGSMGHPHVRYNNVRVPAQNMLGGEGKGFELAQVRLSGGRLHHAMRTISVCQYALDMMCERANSRVAHGGLIREKQAVQQAIANSYAELKMFRLYVLNTAWDIDNSKDGYNKQIRTDIAMTKVLAYKLHHDIVERSVHIHGALGCSDEMPLARMWMDAPTQGLMDGPYEAHQSTVARNLLRQYPAQEGLWPREWLPGKRAAAAEKHKQALAEMEQWEKETGSIVGLL